MPTPRSTSARPIASAAACRPTSPSPRAGSSARPRKTCRCPDHARACCCFRTATRPRACKWLKAAAEQGEPRALLVYGTALFNGDGVAQDPVLGYAFVSRAAAQGLAPAKDTLAQLDKLMPLDQRKKGVASPRPRRRPRPHPPQSGETEQAGAVATQSRRQRLRRSRVAAAKPAPARPPPRQRAPGASSSAPSRSGLGRSPLPQARGKHALAGRRAFYIPVGAMTRLQVGPFESKAAAGAACEALVRRPPASPSPPNS